MERPAGGGAAPSPCTPLPLVYRHRHAQLRNTTSSTTSHKEATKAPSKHTSAARRRRPSPYFVCHPISTLTRLLPIMLHICDHYHSSLSLVPRALANRLDDSSSSSSSSSAASASASASSSPSPYSAPLMLLTEPSQKTLAEPLQKTLLRGDGRNSPQTFS